MALPTLHEALVFKMIDNLPHTGAISHSRGWLHLLEHTLTFSAKETALWEGIVPLVW